jgi:hypothetical protein
MQDIPLIKGARAAQIYAEAQGNILRGFPLHRLDRSLDGALEEAGVNAWRDAEEILYEEACLDVEEDGLPWLENVMRRDPRAIQLYFEYAHSNPAFSLDMINNEVRLAFPVYGRPEEYIALSLPTEDVGQLLAGTHDELDKACDILRDDPMLLTRNGVPRALILKMQEMAQDALEVFRQHTDWEPGPVAAFKASAQWLKGDLTPGLAIGAKSHSPGRTARPEEIKDMGKVKKTGAGFPKSDLNPN